MVMGVIRLPPQPPTAGVHVSLLILEPEVPAGGIRSSLGYEPYDAHLLRLVRSPNVGEPEEARH
jgi:hypothetical protein